MKSLLLVGVVKVDVEELEGVGVLGGGDDSEPLSHEVLLPIIVATRSASVGAKDTTNEGRTRTSW